MYGYIVPNEPELKVRELKEYKKHYCGLCFSIKKSFGNLARFSLQNDMTFLLILLDSLYEPDEVDKKKVCIAHPFTKQEFKQTPITEYVADMNILLAYYKLKDDVVDDGKFTARLGGTALKKPVRVLTCKYKGKIDRIEKAFLKLSSLEAKASESVDEVAGAFGEVLEEVFSYKDDEWRKHLSRLGFLLGKFIYISDAYDDLEEDLKKSEYNCLDKIHKAYKDEAVFDNFIEDILNSVMAEATAVFEILPLIRNVELLRNILYAGVWAGRKAARGRLKPPKDR